MSYTAQPDNWDECLSIQEWLEQWITTDPQKTILAAYLVAKDRFSFESYLLGVMGTYFSGLSNQEQMTIWNCAYRCYKIQEDAATAAITSTTMPSTNSIRW